MVVRPVFTTGGGRVGGVDEGVEGAEWMDWVETRTPGTSVRELRGPGGWRPRVRVGRRSRRRRRRRGEGAGVGWAIGKAGRWAGVMMGGA